MRCAAVVARDGAAEQRQHHRLATELARIDPAQRTQIMQIETLATDCAD